MESNNLIYYDNVMKIYLLNHKIKFIPIDNILLKTINKFFTNERKIKKIRKKLIKKYGKLNIQHKPLEIENEKNIIQFLNLYVTKRNEYNQLYLLYYKDYYYLKNLKKIYNEYFKICNNILKIIW